MRPDHAIQADAVADEQIRWQERRDDYRTRTREAAENIERDAVSEVVLNVSEQGVLVYSRNLCTVLDGPRDATAGPRLEVCA